jgi:ubiquitin carboxyl-terminal hydrolase 22/27/51
MCDDLVWDPTFEELRLKKMGTGTFSSEHLAAACC